ncbi:metal ABC transporter permease [Ottowia caeni]|uniref:metal ABC transporter permease n=1 Tax=Ottowia caeni TaxID=2870339 RepID=UPI003D706952
MTSFMDWLWQGLFSPWVEFGFMRRAWAGCLALSLSAAPMGVFLMLRRMSLMGDAVAHGILPGAALGYLFAGLSLGWMTVGGIAAGMLVAVASGWVARSTVLKEDSSLATFYLMSLALGVLIVSTRGNNVDLLHVLFGTVLSLNDEALLLLGGLSTLTMAGLALLYRPLVMECLDPSFLRQVSRWSPVAHYGFLALLVVNLVAGFHALGTLMSVGMLVLPAAAARFWARQVGAMLWLAVAFALLGCTSGLLISFHADWPSGPSIVLCLGGIYLSSIALGRQGLIQYRPHSHLKG